MQILALLQRLTNALGPSCIAMSHFVLPVLEYTLSMEGPEVLILIEDALSLWLVTLRNVPGNSHDVLRLWPKWVEIMSSSIEHVPVCMMIASSCILLGKAEFIQVGSSFSCSDALPTFLLRNGFGNASSTVSGSWFKFSLCRYHILSELPPFIKPVGENYFATEAPVS